jgi:hypothetical protein
MSDEQITLASAFEVDKAAAGQAEGLKKSESFQSVKQKMSEKFGGVKLPSGFYDGLIDLLVKNLHELLAIDIPKDILANTWKNQKMLREYCDRQKYPADQKFLVPMIEHTLKTSHEPSMEVSVLGQSIGNLPVKLEAAFLIKGATLEVQDGKIKKIQIGDLDSTGQLQFLGVPVLEKKITIHIPGAYDLKEGVEIKNP